MLQTKGNISTGSPSCKSFPVHQCTCSASHCCSRLRLLATLGAIAGAVGGPNFWRRPKALIRSHHGTFTRISSFNLQFCYGQKNITNIQLPSRMLLHYRMENCIPTFDAEARMPYSRRPLVFASTIDSWKNCPNSNPGDGVLYKLHRRSGCLVIKRPPN